MFPDLHLKHPVYNSELWRTKKIEHMLKRKGNQIWPDQPQNYPNIGTNRQGFLRSCYNSLNEVN